MKKTKVLRLLAVSALLSIVAVAGLACNKIGVGKQSTVEAEEFVLKDSDGNVRAVIGFSDDYQAEPGIHLLDNYGEVRVSLSVFEDGTPGIGMFDSEGELRVMVAVDENDEPGIYLYDESGTLRALVDVDEDQSPGIYFSDDDGNMRAMLTVFDDGIPDLTFFDENGDIVWGSP